MPSLVIVSKPIVSPLANFLSLRSASLRSRFSRRSRPQSPPIARRSPLPPPPMAIPRAAPMSSIAVDNEVGLAGKFWIKFRRESLFAMYTPFALCLASGNLKIDSFRHYIAQDVYFLKAFAQAYELAEECTDDDEANIAISKLRKDVLEELRMHDSFAQVSKEEEHYVLL